MTIVYRTDNDITYIDKYLSKKKKEKYKSSVACCYIKNPLALIVVHTVLGGEREREGGNAKKPIFKK